MKLTVIGATGSMSGPESAASCYLLQTEQDGRTYSVVFDLGPGSFGQLWKYIDPKDLDAIVLSHCHADHMGDIVSLYVHRKWHPSGCLGPIALYGPADTAHRTAQIDGWASPEELEEVFDFQTLHPGSQFSVGPLQLTAYPGNHTVESYGFRVEEGETSFAYTGDTDSCPEIETMADRVDLLLSECGFTAADAPRGIHLDGARAGELASRAQVGNLAITHVQPWTSLDSVASEVATTWGGPVSFARAGRVYQVGG